jgi:alpha-D-xyloside xylohydrolase
MWFPQGSWKDCWTGEIIEGGQEKEVSWPSDRGGALYMREGAIIPFGPVMQYRGEKPLDEITLYIFPGKEPSSFSLYEDDGMSMDHLKGDFSITPVTVKKEDGQSVINIGKSAGSFNGKVENRHWNIVMHSDMKPSFVSLDGNRIPSGDYLWDENRKEVTINGINAPSTISIK